VIQAKKPNVVSFSGGRTSAYLVWLFEQEKKRNPNIQIEYLFCDTGAEHPATYKFIKQVAHHWGIKITCLQADVIHQRGVGVKYKVIPLEKCKQDLSIFSDVCKKYGTPLAGTSHCTHALKTTPSDKYCNEKYGVGNYVKWLGIRIDEPQRIKLVDDQMSLFEVKEKYKPKLLLQYLAQISEATKEDILDFWHQQPFDLEIPEYLGNCVFCIKKGSNKIALAAKAEPEMAELWNKVIKNKNNKLTAAKAKIGLKSDQVYRNRTSLDQIIKSYELIGIDELEQMVYKSKRLDSGSCSESCEAIGVSDNYDLFAD
jgi:hypothetical protein